jgi:hypothetical protein
MILLASIPFFFYRNRVVQQIQLPVTTTSSATTHASTAAAMPGATKTAARSAGEASAMHTAA